MGDGEVQAEFERAAAHFAARTQGRFDDLSVVDFARPAPGSRVVEVGAGTGNFLSLFEGVVGQLVAVDLTAAMLAQARSRFPEMNLVVGDGRHLPLRSRSVDLVASAQVFHHISDPLAILKEMARVASVGGRILIVDQVAPERYEDAIMMTRLEKTRDPTHATSRPPSAFRVLIGAAGLTAVDEKIVEGRQSLSQWMWPGEFPDERFADVRAFIEEHGSETGMDFERDGDDWTFTRRRIMLLATVG